MCVCLQCFRHTTIPHETLYLTVDSIEANVEQGAHRVEEGNKQLVKAIKHQVQM